MATIKQLKKLTNPDAVPAERVYEDIYPVTHERAVMDDNGNSLEQKLQNIESDVQQVIDDAESDMQDMLEQSAVRTDTAQDLTDAQKATALGNLGISGVDDVPTAGSDNLVKSGGVVETYGEYVENPEWIKVITDKDDKILCGIKADGSIEWSVGVPTPVIKYIQNKISELSLDEYEDIVAFLGNLIEGDNLATILTNIQNSIEDKVDKVEGKSLIDEDYAENVGYTESSDFIKVVTDNSDQILYGVRTNGDFVFGAGVPESVKEYAVAKETGKGLSTNDFTDEQKDFVDSNEYIDNNDFIKVVLDSDGAIVEGVKSNGETYYGIGVPRQITDYVDENIEETMSNRGIEQPRDTDDFAYTIIDTEEKVVFGVKSNGEVYIAKEPEPEPEPIPPLKVVCWGDSLTAGAGSSVLTDNWDSFCETLVSMGYPDFSSSTHMNYVQMLQNLMGEEYELVNCGVGGESIITIMARLGSEQVYLPTDLSLPATTDVVDIVRGTDVSLPSKYEDRAAKLLIQGYDNSVNPCYVDGIECTLSIDTPVSYQTAAYKIKRNSTGTALTIKSGTPLILKGSSVKMGAEITILWCWQNGGYTDNNDLVQILQNAIASIPNNKYILIGLHSGDESSRNAQETLLEKTFGDKYFNWRRYVSSIAMTEFGLTPTSDDIDAMASGSCPPSLRKDAVHLNAIGYSILGIKLYQKIKMLNY